jgi:hypothetical protein
LTRRVAEQLPLPDELPLPNQLRAETGCSQHQVEVASSSTSNDTAAEAAERATLEARVHELRQVSDDGWGCPHALPSSGRECGEARRRECQEARRVSMDGSCLRWMTCVRGGGGCCWQEALRKNVVIKGLITEMRELLADVNMWKAADEAEGDAAAASAEG